jgi:hypothetical protein
MPATADSKAGRVAFTHPDFVLFQTARFLIVAASDGRFMTLRIARSISG